MNTNLKPYAIVGTVTAIIIGFMLWFVPWAVEDDRNDFIEFCRSLDAHAQFEYDWVCIRDGVVVYGDR